MFRKNQDIRISNYFSKGARKRIHPIVFSMIVFVCSYSVMNIGALTVLGQYYISNYVLQDSIDPKALASRKLVPHKLPVAGPEEVEKMQDISRLASNLEILPKTDRIIIPRLGVNAPIQFMDDKLLATESFEELEASIQDELREGVVHYPGTAMPDEEEGNVFVTGHSSYYPWDKGRYKDVFAILHAAKVGDEVYIVYKGKKYKAIIEETKVVLPTDVDVLHQGREKKLTLMTCTPVGTNAKRLILQAKFVEETEESIPSKI